MEALFIVFGGVKVETNGYMAIRTVIPSQSTGLDNPSPYRKVG